MPTYEYECDDCGHTFEKFQSITARPLRKCPKCGGAVRRLIGTGAGVIFKGSGFYETDYKRKRSEKPADDKKPAESKTDSVGAEKQSKKQSKEPSGDE
jgi:putative FmdB family regulatory protein